MILLGKVRPNRLQRVFESQREASVTYAEQGATRESLPPRFTHDELSVALGSGRALFEACAQHLDVWGLQHNMGFTPFPEDSIATEGTTVILSLPVAGVTFVAACRVIYTVREPTRHGFAYGTLPMHPECGEEYFGLRLDPDDSVTFEITAFSRPHARVARLGHPITRQIQRRALRKYLTEMQEFAQRFDERRV